ncbi:hypothetical protein D9M68_995200 [compost metagenome]
MGFVHRERLGRGELGRQRCISRPLHPAQQTMGSDGEVETALGHFPLPVAANQWRTDHEHGALVPPGG